MGHYLSDFEDRPADRWNYKRVNDLGFESVYTSSSFVRIKRCPVCLCLVEGEHAEAHWTRMHGAD